MRLLIGGTVSTRKIDPTLLRAIARGRKWFQELVSGKAAFTREIAAREGVNERRWKFAHLRLIRFTASKALCVARFRKCRFRPVRHLTLRYSLRNLRVGKAVFRPRPLNHRLGGRGRKTALVDSSVLC